MKLKNIFRYLMMALLVVHLSACNSDTDAEQKFDVTPTERLNAQKKELNDLLLSSEQGWKAVYFTDDTQLGGFTHLFKFLPGKKVEMASDFDDDTEKYTSDYDVVLGSTVSVLFNTFNRIHLLSDSDNYPTAALRGKGYLGDFQFLYYGQENGDIIFKSNRLVREVRFVKATAQDWVDLEKNLEMEEKVIGEDTRPLFRFLETNDGTTAKKYDFSFSSVTRFSNSEAIDNSGEVISMGIGYTPTGIVVSPAIEVKGQKLTNFLYNDADGSFTATGTAGVSASIKYSNAPLVLTDDYKLLLPGSGNNVYGYIYNLTKFEGANSALFLSLLGNSEQAAGAMLTRVQLWFNNADGTNYIEYRFGDATGATIARRYHYFTLTANATNKTVTFTPGVWKSSTAVGAPAIATPSFLKNLDDQFMNPQGLYFAEISGLGYKAYTFTSTTTPFRMVAYSFQ
ncbi:DUF4302 domain-containing protein [Flavobacterium hydrophilum]|uniref:DUF4302 domain-containing protein n=1 Tax=Flavobacterium hydrophilum TaxID=2211445 RepID=A0A2V4C882_9FLAO|nr:DUF4302 domain-containing protein [Flavobacterium hydrophilum]PXY47275.1 hypothetical protein DMB68_09045 [Flavobacterium hydrophilum]